MFQYRCETVVPQRMAAMERAVVEEDFPTFARLTMQDSNQFHAVCLDSYPPILYLNDTSKRVMQLVTGYNELGTEEKVLRRILSSLSPSHSLLTYGVGSSPTHN